MMSTTSTEPSSACSRTDPMDREMKTELSSSTVSFTPGTSRLIRATSARTAVATATVFSPDCLVTCIRTPGLPLIRSTDRMSSFESTTVAMSRR